MIYYREGFVTTHVTCWKFPDGTVGADINVGGQLAEFDDSGNIELFVKFGDVSDSRGNKLGVNDILACLAQTVDELHHQKPAKLIDLIIPYVPYARQDRYFSNGEAHGMRFMAKLINGMSFNSVTVLDPHSSVVEALIDRCHVVDQFDVFKNIYPGWGNVHILAPDLGAVKKSQDFAKKAGAAGVIVCEKKRVDGEVVVNVLSEIPEDSNILVLDDICDGGKTFVEASKGVYNACVSKGFVCERIDLAVTHGLFTAGFDLLDKYFDKIHTTDSFISNKDHPNVKVTELG